MVKREYYIFFVFLLALALFLTCSDAMAAQTNLHNPSASFTGLLDLVKQNSATWDGKLKVYAKTLFWLLASIQLVWTFFPLLFKQSDIGEIVGELIRFIMVTGFFYALLLFSTDWAGAVVESFRQAGASAANLGTSGLRPGDVFGAAIDLANTISNVSTWNPFSAIMISLSALVVLICFAFIAAFMAVTIIESYIVISASVIFMGFGGSQWTREYALAIARYAVSVGAKLFVLTLIVGLIVDSAKQWAAAYTTDDASMWTMVGLSITCAYLAKTIPELIASVISGTSHGGGSHIGSMAAAAAAGATAAIATVATAGAAAPAVAAAGASGAGGSGLAASISSSLAGGGQMAARATGSASSSAGSGMSGISAAPKPPTYTGGGASSAGPSTQKLNSGAQQAAKQVAKVAQGNNKDEAKQPQANQGSGLTGHKIASAATRSVGILSSISVPGMERASSLSLGAGGTQPPAQAPEGSNDTSMEAKAVESQNVIRPSEPPTESKS